LLLTPEEILKKYWGYDRFRPLQREIITHILEGNDTLALLPTGGGKSLCYQVPALMLDGLCLVVSPLIALMQDQVARLLRQDVTAACIHSGMHYNDVRRLLDNALHDGYKLLYISPERLQTRMFQDYMQEMDVSMIAVDEAHCISQWGHDFRPNYLKIASARAVYPRAPILALTASATTDVQQDIAQQLHFRKAATFKQSFSRNNIYYQIQYSENKNDDTLARIPGASSIVYCRSRKQTEMLGKYLEQYGRTAAVYHAGLPREQREGAQERWMSDKARTMVATTAFGMGIDKPDVRLVLHYDAAEHLEAYYQEAGRAGRDGKPSEAVGLFNSGDIKRMRESVELQFPPESFLRAVYQAVVEYLQIPIGNQPDRYFNFDLADFCSKFDLLPGKAIHALKLLEQEGLWTLTEAVYNPATILFTADRHTLDDLKFVDPDLAYVCVGLLRMYNTIFHYPTAVRETAIAKQLKIAQKVLVGMLERLDAMEILEYNKPGEGPQLFFHHYRVDSRYLVIDLNRIAKLRKRHIARTEAMIDFLENTDECRETILLRYFGEQPEADCGHCDNCSRKNSKSPDRDALKHEILACLTDGAMPIRSIVAKYPVAIKETVMALLREMIDEGLVHLGPDNVVYRH
jgi:ATP-dependent DNA helicase RecQ